MKPAGYGLIALLTSVATGALLNIPQTQAQPAFSTNQPVLLQADHMGYDSTNKIVIAQGNVEVVQGETILLADRIVYFQTRNKVQAEGNVSLLEQTGTVYFADKVELSDDLKTGVINEFRIRLPDQSLFAAAQARRESETRTKLKKAVYSPCHICTGETASDTPAPLWQIKADKVTIDEDKQNIDYRDVWFEVYGVPVLYSPYFSHPTPNADRKSGILQPEYSQNSQLGTVVTVPYYWNIAPDKDATITPHFTTEEGLVLEGQYRQLTDLGSFQFDGSATLPRERDALGKVIKGRDVRGHLFATGNSRINERWGWGFNINRSSDDTYLRRYGFGAQETLTSRLFAERIHQRDYMIMQGLAFQGLRVDDDPDQIPLIAPALHAHIESNPLWGSPARASMDIRSASVTRRTGAKSRYASLLATLSLPHRTSDGHILEADASLRTDIYSISDIPQANGREFSGTETRSIPQLALKWRYPLIRQVGNASLIIEPQAQLILSSNGNNPETIPNEDSLAHELSDITLFDPSPFPGVDRVENGSRFLYAVRGRYQTAQGHSIRMMLGQNYHLSGDTVLPSANGRDPDRSDYVGHIGVQAAPLDLSYRFRLDRDDLGLRRSENTWCLAGKACGCQSGLYLY